MTPPMHYLYRDCFSLCKMLASMRSFSQSIFRYRVGGVMTPPYNSFFGK